MSSFGELFRSSLRRSLRFFRRCGMKRDGKGEKNRRSGCLYGIGFRRTISGCVFGATSSCPPPRRRKDTAGRFGGYAKVGALMFWCMEMNIRTGGFRGGEIRVPFRPVGGVCIRCVAVCQSRISSSGSQKIRRQFTTRSSETWTPSASSRSLIRCGVSNACRPERRPRLSVTRWAGMSGSLHRPMIRPTMRE